MKNKSDAGRRSRSESPPVGRTRPVASFREMGSHFLAFRTNCGLAKAFGVGVQGVSASLFRLRGSFA